MASTKDAALTGLGYLIGLVGAFFGFILMVIVGGAIIFGFTLVLGLIWNLLTGG